MCFNPGFSVQPQVLTSEVSDWRKNVEAMSGMEGRKKMFDTGGAGQWDALWRVLQMNKAGQLKSREEGV